MTTVRTVWHGWHRACDLHGDTVSPFCEPDLSQALHNTTTGNTQINWLELARFAADGQGHSDLGRGIKRLATLAAAVHRQTVAQPSSTVRTEKDTQRVQGRTPQADPSVTEDRS